MPIEKWLALSYNFLAVAWVEFYETRGKRLLKITELLNIKKARLGRAYIELALGLLANY